MERNSIKELVLKETLIITSTGIIYGLVPGLLTALITKRPSLGLIIFGYVSGYHLFKASKYLDNYLN